MLFFKDTMQKLKSILIAAVFYFYRNSGLQNPLDNLSWSRGRVGKNALPRQPHINLIVTAEMSLVSESY